MIETPKQPLQVFLCHTSSDKPAVRALYRRLKADGIAAWLDEEDLDPGDDWQLVIPKTVRHSDVVIVCLSSKSVNKEGYVQKEIAFALDTANEKPEGMIYLIPAKLEECEMPERLKRWQWVDLTFNGNSFEQRNYDKLMRSLRRRADSIGTVLELPKKQNIFERLSAANSKLIKTQKLFIVEKTRQTQHKQALSRFVIQCMQASREFLVILLIFGFFGASTGETIRRLLHIEYASLNGLIFGGIFGATGAFFRILPKWNYCYLNQHEYGQEIGWGGDGGYDLGLIDRCKRCGKPKDDE